MKKIILCMPTFHGYEEQIIQELEKQGFIVKHYDYNSYVGQKRRDRTIFHKILNNIYFKIFTKRNLKTEVGIEEFEKEILKQSREYKYFLKIGPIVLREKTLNIIKQNYEVKIVHHWDSIGKFISDETINIEKKYFDTIFSYDKKDCEKYNLKYLPNYYFENESKAILENKVFTIMADESRLKLLEKISIILKNKEMIPEIILVTKNKKIESNEINITRDFLTLKDVLEKEKNSKFILEINRKNNYGYTFRTMDCIGMRKKLITNNKLIINEDFYNSNNILIINEDNIEIPEKFINSSYEELSKEIYEKYSLKNWVERLLTLK